MTASAALPLAGRDATLAPSPATDYTCPECGGHGTRPTCRTDCPRRISVIAAPDSLDVYEARGFREDLIGLAGSYSRIVIDMAGCRYMDTTGLAVLIGALRRARAQGGSVVLAGPRPSVLRMLAVTGMARLLRTADDVDGAMALLAGDPA